MPLFRCESCGCVENTALSNYWTRNLDAKHLAMHEGREMRADEFKPAQCSACDPDIAKWHNEFKKQSAEGMLVGGDGFLYYEVEFKRRQVHHTKVRGVIRDGVEAAWR